MKLAFVWVAVAVVACRGPGPSQSSSPPTDTGTSTDRGDDSGDSGSASADGSDEPDAGGSDDTAGDSDGLGWASVTDATRCELSCADVYGCVLVEDGPDDEDQDQDQDQAEAAAIELACLGACVSEPESQSLAACERPTAPTPEACPPFLACVREAWPGSSDEPGPGVVPASGDGCLEACRAFARCADAPTSAAEECAQQCREVLDEDQQRRAGQCAELDSCEQIERCILSLPGA